ncbi:MAG: aminotransferase class V-fold PLP-dependent enzyme [Planctomycetota bacterium]
MIYANHAGTSWPKAPGVAAAMHAALLADPRENAERYRDAHAAIGRFLRIESQDRLVLTPSCTAALAVIVGDLAWQRGDAVLTSQLEHHALARSVQKLVTERGVEHRIAAYQPGRPIDLDAVESQLRDGRVRLVAVTGASNITGECLPIAELATLARRYGALTLLDAAQVAGLLPLDVAALGIDLLTFAGHKALLGPLGIGGFWSAPHVTFDCPTAVCAIGARDDAGARRRPAPGFCDVGSVNLPGAMGLAAALRWLGERSATDRERPLALARRLYQECLARPRCRVLGGTAPPTAPRTTTVSLLVEGLPLERAEAHFAARDIVVRAGQHCAAMALDALGEPAGCLRLSVGATSGEDDVAAILAALDEV